MKLSERFPSKRAFITGAGSGLGKALALQLAADGWSIGITDMSEERLANTVTGIEDAGGKAYPFVFDVSDSEAYRKVADDFGRHIGIDLLINNAGVGDGGAVDDYPIDRWDWIIGINQMGVIYGCHFFIPYMKKQRAGHIVNISSAASFANLPEMGPYNAAKAAVTALSETLYGELHGHNVGVTVVMPTFFQSNIHQHSSNEMAKETTQLLMAQSKLPATEVAAKVLDAAGRNQFRLFPQKQSKSLFLFSRWFPNSFMNMKLKMYKRKDEGMAKLRAKYGSKI